ncbi:MAG: type II toxin-antitoxin system RelE/ParE family toxin [Gemmataceae bacterium]|nr:type II toxin-antitoxin system RelE/ParE family toxin [Gemmataceae bacterium]
MSLPLVTRRAAQSEFDDAIDWYERQRAGLGPAFAAAVRRVLNAIAAQPRLYAEVYQDAREAPVPKYPYCVYYRDEGTRVLILSVFHTSRDPAIWQGRV